MFKKQKLKGKVIAITGAARGIGLGNRGSFNCTRCKSQYW